MYVIYSHYNQFHVLDEVGGSKEEEMGREDEGVHVHLSQDLSSAGGPGTFHSNL